MMNDNAINDLAPIIEFGVGWAKVHFRRELTEQDRAKLVAALSCSAQSSLTGLAEELREYTAMKYAGDCKCGKCQLVPRALIDRLYAALMCSAE